MSSSFCSVNSKSLSHKPPPTPNCSGYKCLVLSLTISSQCCPLLPSLQPHTALSLLEAQSCSILEPLTCELCASLLTSRLHMVRAGQSSHSFPYKRSSAMQGVRTRVCSETSICVCWIPGLGLTSRFKSRPCLSCS